MYVSNNGDYFKTIFVLASQRFNLKSTFSKKPKKKKKSKVILGNPFMILLHPFQNSEEGTSIEILGKNLLFKVIVPLNNNKRKEVNQLKEMSIFK